MLVFNDTKGYRAYCFRCESKPFVPHGDFSIEQLRRRREELQWTQSKSIILPKDFTTDIPPREAVWLYKAGVSPALAKHYGFGYSAFLRRVILPIYRDGKLEGYTARNTINERPKYIEKASSPDAYFATDPAVRIGSGGCCTALEEMVVFTEDILSATRVGRVCGQAYALMGTTLPSELLAKTRETAHSVAVWLDPDKAGVEGSRGVQRSLALAGCTAKIIRSSKDPKYYTNKQIREYLLT
jgi:DNA primase